MSRDSRRAENAFVCGDGQTEHGVATPCSAARSDKDIIYHITWATHNSRISERMIKHRVIRGEPVLLELEEEIIVTKIIADIVREKGFKIHAYNICKDHVHAIIESPADKIANTVRLLKGKSAQKYKEHLKILPEIKFHLWAQKFNKWRIETPMQYYKTVTYIVNNRKKHRLPESEEMDALVSSISNTEACW